MNQTYPKFKVRKKTLGSYPYISVVLSITLALFVMGIFGLLMIYSTELERSFKENVRIEVYLNNNLTPAQRLQIEKNLSTQYFIPANTPGPLVVFTSKDDAAKKLIEQTGKDFRPMLGENPLRDAFSVKVAPAYQEKASLAKIKTDIQRINGVFQVDYSENLIQSINENMTKIGLISLGLTSLLFLMVALLINNTLRLALFSQRFLIRSMQLVGAKRWFIQRPFLMRASLHGMIAGLITSALLIALISFGNRYYEDLQLIQNNNRILMLFGTLVLLGIFVAVFSTYRAIRKYLKLSLDELY